MKYQFSAVKSLGSLSKLVERLRQKNMLYAIDIETTGKDPWRDKIVGVGLCWDTRGAVYVPIRHKYDQPFIAEDAIEVLRPLLLDHQFIAFNALFELEFLENDWKLIPNISPIDTSLLTASEGLYEYQNLKVICTNEFPELGVQSFREFMGLRGLTLKATIDEIPVDAVADYCGRDTLACMFLYSKLYITLQHSFVYRLESALQPVVQKFRRSGVLIDREFFESEEIRLEDELANIKRLIDLQVSAKIGTEISFNINSSKQLGGILYDQLGLRCSRVTAAGARKTDKKTLARLKWKHPVVHNIIVYKELEKRRSTFYAKYPNYIQGDGRIHSSLNPTGAPTGRFSSSDPNLQNIPRDNSWIVKRDEDTYVFETNPKLGFIVPDDCWFLNFDFSQIEVRMAAGFTKDPVLLNAFAEGVDFHTKTASLIFNVAADSVSKQQRFMGKTLNFALSYGMGKDELFYNLLKDQDIAYNTAGMFHEKYKEAYSTMFHVAKEVCIEAGRRRFTQTIWGRRIPVFDSNGTGAYNYVIQGSAADLVKVAIVKINKELMKKYDPTKWKFILTVHDSISFEVHKSLPLDEFISDVKNSMEYQMDGYPPFIVDYGIGTCWGDLSEPDKKEPIADFVKRFIALMGSTGGREFVLEFSLNDRFSESSVNQLVSFIKDNKGNNAITIKVGDKQLRFEGTSLSLDYRDKILFVLGCGTFYEVL